MKFALCLIALMSFAPLSALAADKADAGKNIITITGFNFSPGALTIHAGETVTWVNKDAAPHTILGKDNAFKSPVLGTDDKYSLTFQKAGEYPYACAIHAQMTGTITVTP